MRLCLLLLACLLPLAATGQIIKQATLTLVDENGFNEVDIDLDVAIAGASDDTSSLTGTVEVQVNVTPDLSSTSELTILSADVSGSDISLSRSFLFTSLYSLRGENLRFSAETTSPPGLVDVTNGEFDASQHEITVDQGTFSGSAVGTDNIEFNFNDDPFVGQGAGTGTVLITPGRIEDRKLYFDITVELPALIDETIDEAGVEADIEIQGTIKATGESFIELLDYPTWATQNGLASNSQSDFNLNLATPNQFLFALGLDQETLPSQLFTVSPAGVALATAGDHALGDFEIQWSQDLDNWETVPPASMISGSSSIAFGDPFTNPPIVALSETFRYLRLAEK